MNPSLLRTKVNENTYSQQSINSVSVAPEHVALEPKIKAVVWDVKTEQDGGTTGSNNNGNSFFLYSERKMDALTSIILHLVIDSHQLFLKSNTEK